MLIPIANQPLLTLKRGFPRLFVLALVLALAVLVVAQSLAGPTAVPAPDVKLDLSSLPLSFIPNAGQTDPAVRFQTHDMGGTVFFTADEVVLVLPAAGPDTSSVLRLHFVGANPAPQVTSAEQLPGVVNYFTGRDPAAWRTNVPTYAGVVYQQLYPGIDLRYDGTSGRLKGTYVVAPGADPGRIRWQHAGATQVTVDAATGNLVIGLAGAGQTESTLVEQAPVAWQNIGGRQVPVTVGYDLGSDGAIGFALGTYNPAYPLTIDPTLIYSTYLGGTGRDDGEGIAVDGAGNAYVTGSTSSTNFPTQNALQGSKSGASDEDDVFVSKINVAGNSLVYSTFLGGAENDQGNDIAVDGAGNAYITGRTHSTDFPTQNPIQANCKLISGFLCLGDAFVTKLNASGNALVYSTYLGGDQIEQAEGIAVDSSGNAYVAGSTTSTNFPTQSPLQGSLGGGFDAYVAKLNAAGSALVYSTYLGGSGEDFGREIAVDGSNAFVVGSTNSANFPTQNPAQAAHAGQGDAFVAQLNAAGSALAYSTYLGGSGEDTGYAIAVTGGEAYVTGSTESANFPTQNPLQGAKAGGVDAFVTKMTGSGALAYSTYLGGGADDTGNDIAVNSAGNAYVTGKTASNDFPTQTPLQGTRAGSEDVFVTKLNVAGTALEYSTYLGGSHSDLSDGIAVDNDGNAYVTGISYSSNFPTESALQANNGGGDFDAFVVKISDGGDQALPPPAPSSNLHGSHKTAAPGIVTPGDEVTYTILLKNDGTADTTADVADEIPDGMTYVAGSASNGGQFDSGTNTVSWDNVPVPANGEVSLTFKVTADAVSAPSLVINTAVITPEGEDSFERSYPVLVTPEPIPSPELAGSHKRASRLIVGPNEELTYTIWLHNSGTQDAIVDVTDEVPSEVDYVDGSVTGGGSYDPGARTVSWTGVSVPAGDHVALTFDVKASTVDFPRLVLNTAVIEPQGGDSFHRSFPILLVPVPTGEDPIPPDVVSLTIEDRDVLDDPSVTLHISASADATEMYLREWHLVDSPVPHWKLVQSSEWVPFQADYPWTLTADSGTHYVGVWVRDDAGNVSRIDRRATDFASLLLPGTSIDQHDLVAYLVYYGAGENVTATLTPSAGDPDLYVWYPGNFGLPDQKSAAAGTATDQVSFTTPRAGTYLFLVHGYEASTYNLAITPAGGPKAWATTTALNAESSQQAAGQAAANKDGGLVYEPILTWSGLDPLATAQAPAGPTVIFLPMISHNTASAADLVASLSTDPASPKAGQPVALNVEVSNVGNADASAFWVDLYIDPKSAPTGANQIWSQLGSKVSPFQGLAWYVPGLAAGESITLNSSGFSPAHSIWSGALVSGTQNLYVYVDSFNPGVADGAVRESNEANNRAELLGVNVAGPNVIPTGLADPASLPPR